MNERNSPSNEERQMLRDAARGTLGRVWPAADYETAIRDPRKLAEAWKVLCSQGFAALGSNPSEGGLQELAAVFEELGRAACLAPLLPAALANFALQPLADKDKHIEKLLNDTHAGVAILAVSFGDCDRGRDVGQISLLSGRANGTLDFVEAAEIATHFLVFIRQQPGVAVIKVDPRTLKIEPSRAMGAPGLARVTFTNALADVIPLPTTIIATLLDVSRLCLAARSYGSTRRVFELAVDYANERKQFGRLIGTFQAVQHKLANNLIALESARLSIEYATECHDRGSPHWRLYAAATFATVASSLRQVALENHHAFGAIGYAEDHEAPRHFKRIHVDLLRHGGWAEARSDLADFYLDETVRKIPEIDLGERGNAFREEVRAWLRDKWPEARADEFYGRPFEEREFDPEFAAELGENGWIGLNWPKRVGGQERSPLELIGFMEVMEQFEAPRAGAPVHGNMLIVKGTPEQQAERLPEILKGRVLYGMGLSEPNSGSDLASLTTRAVRDGDDWTINGQKIWCTTFYGDYLLVAARTDPDAKPQHAGISAFIVRTDAPGLTINPTGTMYDGRFANLYFDNVRVPHKDLVGPINGGWDVIISALATERGFYGGQIIMQIVQQFDSLCDYIRTAKGADGRPLRLDPLVRDRIADLAAQIEVGRRMMLSCARSAQNGVTPLQDAAMGKVYSGELLERFGEAALDILGLQATLSLGAPGAVLRGKIEQKLRNSLMWVISLGTNEIQRSLIAKAALRLPNK